ncbi:MAG: hypothetical protein ABI741_13335 [Ferruginibacter sp.]
MNRYCFSMILLLLCSSQLSAQQVSQKILRSKWVKIMSNDSSYNYLEAEKEFEGFYTDFLAEKKKEQRKQRNRSSAGEDHMESPAELLVAQYLRWSIAIRPFVKADGSIMSLSDRLAIINNNKRN